jgi:glycerol-3-phosphate acyltransferase PlsY
VPIGLEAIQGWLADDVLVGSLILIASGYLLGSVSSTYLVGRWLGRKDLRQYGSGTLGGSMVYEHVSRWAVVPVALFDIAKAALPAWLGLQLGFGEVVAAAAGLAAAMGHNWSVLLRFRGGRGMATFVGVWLVLYPLGVVWMGGLLAIGWRLGDSAPWLLVSLLTLPLLSRLLGGADIVLPVASAMILITLAKRVEADRRPLPPPGPERRRVLLRRVFLDRDVASHEEWIRRQPDADTD